MNLETIKQGEELLKKATPGIWQMWLAPKEELDEEYGQVYRAVSSEADPDSSFSIFDNEQYYPSAPSIKDAQLICFLVNHASELLQMAREVENFKDMMQFDVEGRLLARCPDCKKGYKAPEIAIIS